MHALAQQTVLASTGFGQIAGSTLLSVAGIMLLAYVALLVGALISILASSHTGGMKMAWVVFVFVAPFLGSVLWFLVGRGDSLRRRATV